MSLPVEANPRRIVVAYSSGTLPAMLERLLGYFAIGPNDELRGLFIEDSDLLNAAALPFTFEFCSVTSTRRQIDRAQVETTLRRAAAAAERDLARLAAATGMTWHFDVVRDKRRAALGALLQMTDAIFVAPQAGAAAPAPAESAPVVALVDASAAGARALALARAVAAAERAPLEVHGADEDIAPAANDQTGDTGASSTNSLARLSRRPAARLAVVAVTRLGHANHNLPEICATSMSPLVIVR